jgi:AcrR family transcriptional regulator
VATARLTRSERTALTRRELLDAAQRRFFRDGYHGTTLDDIADEAGYTKGAVYSTFKSKGGLFLAFFDEVVERRVEEIRLLLAPHDADDAKFSALAAQPVDEHNSQFLLLTIEFWVHAAREPALLDAFAEARRRLRSSG